MSILCHAQQSGCTNIGSDIVEEKLAAGRSSHKDSSGELNRSGLIHLAILEVGELVGELSDVVVDFELGAQVRCLVNQKESFVTDLMRVSLALCVQLVDSARSNLEVLLSLLAMIRRARPAASQSYLVGREILLLGLSALLGLRGRSLGGLLLLLGRLPFAGLLALLELGLGDHLAGNIVEVQLADSFGRLIAGGRLLVFRHGEESLVRCQSKMVVCRVQVCREGTTERGSLECKI